MSRLVLSALALLLFAGCSTSDVGAGSARPSVSDIQAKLPNYTIKQIVPSEIEGLYEIHGDKNIIYTDGNYLLVGRILTLDGGRDLTQEKIAKMPVEKKVMDTSSALTVGRGAKEVIMVTDPECPYCMTADEWFKDANATRKIMFLPLEFHPKAAAISEHILCSEKPDEEYLRIMDFIRTNTSSELGNLISCDRGKVQLAAMKQEIDKAGFTGTPMFIIDGQLIEGADPKLKELIR